MYLCFRIVMPEGCLHKAETFSFHASHSVLLETFEFLVLPA